MQSRYYNPEIGRFINADNQIVGIGGSFCGYNLFSYCENNPINRIDPNGHSWKGIKNWASKAWGNIKTTVRSVTKTIKDTIANNAQKHYSRNTKNAVNDTIKNIQTNYTKVSESQDVYHENTSGKQGEQAKYNDKYLSPNGGHYEVIICNAPDIDPYIVDESVDPTNMGTYNYASNDRFFIIYGVEHFFRDMIPYYLYGNTQNDEDGILKWALE